MSQMLKPHIFAPIVIHITSMPVSYALPKTVPFFAPSTRKLIIPLPGTFALAVPSAPTVTAVSFISCVLSVYHALTVGRTSELPVSPTPTVCAAVPVLMICQCVSTSMKQQRSRKNQDGDVFDLPLPRRSHPCLQNRRS
jgi:hypothetical protein